MNEQILVYLLASDLGGQLRQVLNMKRQELIKKPGDILLSADIRKLTNDLTEITIVANKVGESCIQLLSVNYGCKFQFMVPEKKPSGVDGKEIKLTT